jgi:hypothetical protein
MQKNKLLRTSAIIGLIVSAFNSLPQTTQATNVGMCQCNLQLSLSGSSDAIWYACTPDSPSCSNLCKFAAPSFNYVTHIGQWNRCENGCTGGSTLSTSATACS